MCKPKNNSTLYNAASVDSLILRPRNKCNRKAKVIVRSLALPANVFYSSIYIRDGLYIAILAREEVDSLLEYMSTE